MFKSYTYYNLEDVKYDEEQMVKDAFEFLKNLENQRKNKIGLD